jgi:hypothetical protein
MTAVGLRLAGVGGGLVAIAQAPPWLAGSVLALLAVLVITIASVVLTAARGRDPQKQSSSIRVLAMLLRAARRPSQRMPARAREPAVPAIGEKS